MVLCLYFIPFAPKRTKSVWVYSRKILGLSIVRSSLAVVSSYYAFGQSIIDKEDMSLVSFRMKEGEEDYTMFIFKDKQIKFRQVQP